MKAVNLKTSTEEITSLFTKNQFVIPEYQRPYAWKKEHCQTLWDDLIAFYREEYKENYEENKKDKIIYFLGPIVCYEEKKALHIIDGQQRITTLMLLLKASYRKIHQMKSESKKDTSDLRKRIGKCIWEPHSTSGEPFFEQPRIETRVYDNNYENNTDYNEQLKKVLSNYDLDFQHPQETQESSKGKGKKDKHKKDQPQYFENYLFFIDKLDKILKTDWRNKEEHLYDFIQCLENSYVLLPIICNDWDMGLNIFQTINDRGEQLTDVDIFKYELYKSHKDITYQNKKFIEKWNEIHRICNPDPDEDYNQKKVENIFAYTRDVLWAIKKKTTSKIGLRKFYLEKHKEYLKDPDQDLMGMIENQAILWSEIHKDFSKSPAQNHYPNIVPEGDEAKKYIQLLNSYANEYWKWVVSALWHHQKSNGSGIQKLETSDLRKLVAFFYFVYLKYPKMVAELRLKFLRINRNIIKGKTLFEGNVFKSDEKITEEEIKKVVKQSIDDLNAEGKKNDKKMKILLMLHTYLNDHQDYVSEIGTMTWQKKEDSSKNKYAFKFKYEIEHILPIEWKNEKEKYGLWKQIKPEEYVNRVGNKVLLKKKLKEIQAEDGYFNKKKEKYKKSKIAELQRLSQQEQNDWLPEDIKEREEEMIKKFTDFFWKEFKSIE